MDRSYDMKMYLFSFDSWSSYNNIVACAQSWHEI